MIKQLIFICLLFSLTSCQTLYDTSQNIRNDIETGIQSGAVEAEKIKLDLQNKAKEVQSTVNTKLEQLEEAGEKINEAADAINKANEAVGNLTK